GVSRLAAEYGGKRDRGSARYRAVKGGRAIVRKGLQQLEGLGLVKRTPEGRVLTPEGRSLLDREAKKILEELAKERPELRKYL
ncbi:MAG: 40S ribosomal protein S19, partial [Thermoplasmata archaeon]|nr:40S ribosomal protein S19 [Thermoplasmata archaeon]